MSYFDKHPVPYVLAHVRNGLTAITLTLSVVALFFVKVGLLLLAGALGVSVAGAIAHITTINYLIRRTSK